MAKMSDKTKRAINKGRKAAGLKPIKFGAKKKANPHKNGMRKLNRQLIPTDQIPIGYRIGDRKAQLRLAKRYIAKGRKAEKEKVFRKWQKELDG